MFFSKAIFGNLQIVIIWTTNLDNILKKFEIIIYKNIFFFRKYFQKILNFLKKFIFPIFI